MFDVILFDLDGTLTDPGEGITNSVAYALKKLGLAVPERRELYKFIGPPLLDSFQQFYGLTLDQARQGVRWYREYFQDKGMLENVVYDGIPALLADLQDAGGHLQAGGVLQKNSGAFRPGPLLHLHRRGLPG
jgi:phosphoglycolate phosphatase